MGRVPIYYKIGDFDMIKSNVLSNIKMLKRDDWDPPRERGGYFLGRRYRDEQIKEEILHEHIPREYLEKLRNDITIKVSDLIDMVKTVPLDSEENYAMFAFYSMILGHCLNKISVNDVNETYLIIYWCSPYGWSSDEEDGCTIKGAIG